MVARILLADDGAGGWQWSERAGTAARPLAGATARGGAVAIVPAARMRTLAVAVPPAAADKLDAVVRFALEDRLAGEIDLQHVVVARKRSGEALVHVIERRWMVEALDRLQAAGFAITRVVAESDLAPRDDDAMATWIHHDDGGTLIERDGRVTTLDQSGEALPSGVLLAIDRAARESTPTAGDVTASDTGPASAPRIVIHCPATMRPRVDAWARATGARFDLAPEWSWTDAGDATIASAVELATPSLRRGVVRPARERSAWRTAIGWLVAAAVLHAAGTAIAWGSLQWRVARLDRETDAALRGAAPDLAGDARGAWRRWYADFRHRSGKPAPDDALPMLADISEVLRGLPAGAVRSMTFEAGQVTLDIERTAMPALAAAAARWSQAGLGVLSADTPSGVRIRVTRE